MKQSPSAQYGFVLKAKGFYHLYLSLPEEIGIIPQGTRPYLQGWCGFYHYCLLKELEQHGYLTN